MDPWNLIWIFLILTSLQPLVQKHLLALSRRRLLAQIAEKRDETVIALIHRQETISLLGFPLMRHIDIDDAQSVLKAIRSTPPGKTIEIILHTPGGLVLAASLRGVSCVPARAQPDVPVSYPRAVYCLVNRQLVFPRSLAFCAYSM